MSAFEPEEDDYSYAEADPAETSTPPDQSSNAEASHGHRNNPLLGSDNPLVSDLEQEVLEEYTRLLRNVNQVREDQCQGAMILSARSPRKIVPDKRYRSSDTYRWQRF
jgi:hypothetical protein